MKINMHSSTWKSGILFFLAIFISSFSHGQSSWPISGEKQNTKVSVFKPTTEGLNNNILDFRAAIALYEGDKAPVFGAIWGEAQVQVNTSAKSTKMSNVKITDVRFPDGITQDEQSEIISLLQQTFSSKQPVLSLDDISADLKDIETESKYGSQLNNTPPKIYYSKEAALLVTIDGDPILESTSATGIDAVVNTPFLILKYQNNYYLSNGQLWYKAPKATGNYVPEKNAPKAVQEFAKSLNACDDAVASSNELFYPKIIVSMVPAELIQTNGEPSISAIQGTGLLYVENTEEQILFDIKSQLYYVLLSGRWYSSTKLDGTWNYTDPQKLPADFVKIPEGSDKDIVLANIPGTKAASEAIKDAQIPHTAAVSRSTTTASDIYYDGNPVFETIQGTNIRMATNCSGTVLAEGSTYFLVDDGIWFTSNSPHGPWSVSDRRPQHVNSIPPSSPAYNVKYVNIYHSTPEVVYVGYTSGYVSNYVVGPVIVYGTGHHYRPWKGRYYYARPCTWGFGMYYNPWYGWSMNVSYGVGGHGWFGYYSPWRVTHHNHHSYMGCGWWGPPVYRPPYGAPYSHYYGHRPAANRPVHYGKNVSVHRGAETRQIHNTNIYNYNRNGVAPSRGNAPSARQAGNTSQYNYTKQARPADLSREINNRATTRPTESNKNTSQPATRPSNNSSNNNRATTRPTESNKNTNQPATRPSNNSSNNNRATTRPTESNKNTSQPATRPSNNNSSNENRATTRPTESNKNTSQPATRPSNNSSNNNRATTRPTESNKNTNQPATRPSNSNQSTPRSNNSRSTQKPSSTKDSQSSPNRGSSPRR